MYRVFIKENDTPYYNYPTTVVKYLEFYGISEDYDMLASPVWIASIVDGTGEGYEHQLVVI